MKTLIVLLALGASALSAAVPAGAQNHRGDRFHDRLEHRDDRFDRGRGDDRDYHRAQLRPRLDRISWQISQGLQRGRLTQVEAARLRAEHRQVWQIAANYHRTGGYSQREVRDIDARIDRLQQRLRWERQDGDRRFYR